MNQRQAIFVCCALDDSANLIASDIIASSSSDASCKFTNLYGFSAVKIFGPFLKKRSDKPDINKSIKFDSKPQKAEYNGWLVNSFGLAEPADHAMLFFIKKINATAQQPSKGTIIVPIQDLRFL